MSVALHVLALSLVIGVFMPAGAGADALFGAMPFCPFDFAHGMPPGMFCVYDGVAMAADGTACSNRVQVIWTRLAPESLGPKAKNESQLSVYFGFASISELVLRANAEDAAGHRAAFADMTTPDSATPFRLRGGATLRRVADGSEAGTDVLSLRVRRPISIDSDCAFTSFNGTFLGVMTVLPDTTE